MAKPNKSAKKSATKKAATKKAAPKKNSSRKKKPAEESQEKQPPVETQNQNLQHAVAPTPKSLEQQRRDKLSNVTEEAIEKAQKETYDNSVHLTEDQFTNKYRQGTFADFKPGQQFFTKERYGERFVAKPVQLSQNVTLDSAAFNDLIFQKNAYIKR